MRRARWRPTAKIWHAWLPSATADAERNEKTKRTSAKNYSQLDERECVGTRPQLRSVSSYVWTKIDQSRRLQATAKNLRMSACVATSSCPTHPSAANVARSDKEGRRKIVHLQEVDNDALAGGQMPKCMGAETETLRGDVARAVAREVVPEIAETAEDRHTLQTSRTIGLIQLPRTL